LKAIRVSWWPFPLEEGEAKGYGCEGFHQSRQESEGAKVRLDRAGADYSAQEKSRGKSSGSVQCDRGEYPGGAKNPRPYLPGVERSGFGYGLLR
jgi:hypothetical protein